MRKGWSTSRTGETLWLVAVLCSMIALLAAADSRTFNVRETITFVNDGPGECTKLKIVVGLFQDWTPYIEVLSETIGPSSYRITTDEFGNRFAEFTIYNLRRGQQVPVTLDWRIEVAQLSFDLAACDGSGVPADIERYLRSEDFIESSDAQIVAVADSLAAGRSGPCETVEAIYDYVITNITYAGYLADPQGALSCLRNRQGDCTEFSCLMTALCRAAGIPARMIEGVTNEAGDEVHSWMEAYLPGHGWVPFDPTWGRHPGDREKYLAAVTADHIPLVIGIGLDAFDGFSYWAYWYWWDSQSTSVSTSGYDWSVRP
ncbi:transglutaminase-like domain-containing protein [Candidatus Bipolaricaulota bacterium]|nr:transglutaminase-like domain-containing protein [Candidatus Bipolaricaulota bacterium]